MIKNKERIETVLGYLTVDFFKDNFTCMPEVTDSVNVSNQDQDRADKRFIGKLVRD